MNWTRPRTVMSVLALALGGLTAATAATAQELPPAVQLDRYLLQADRYIEEGDGRRALAALNRVLELQAEHGLEIPSSFWFRHGRAALAAGNADTAAASAVRYLELTGQEGEHYVAALELLNDAEAAPGATFSDCDVCPRMVVVPAGTFTMGSPTSERGRDDKEGPQHSVTIPAPFAVGVYEVTFAEWDACVRAGGCGYPPNDLGWGRGSRPVIDVSWDDAQAYVSWLSQQTGARYRLLSEAEWEYVARAGSATARYWGESESGQCLYANGSNSSAPCPDGYEYTAPVGSFAPNAFGLYDVLGNVSEWTQDCMNFSYVGASADGSAWQPGVCSLRILRGGGMLSSPEELRSAHRYYHLPEADGANIGFRVARTLN